MSRTRHFLCLAAIACLLAAPGVSAQSESGDAELNVLLLGFKAKVSQDVELPLAQAQAALGENYIKALDRVQQEVILQGKLEEATALKLEKEAVATGDVGNLPPLTPELRQLPPLRRKYLEAMRSLRASMTSKVEPLQKELVRQLEALALKMARDGKGDVALEARQLAKNYSERAFILEGDWEDHTAKVSPKSKGPPIMLKKGSTIITEKQFKPPVEIEVVAKLESLDLRLGYAADQVIFNWSKRPDELRIDGGLADKMYTPGMGEIPKGKFVTIRWQVSKSQQRISVDGKVRFEHQADYSKIDRPISVMAFGSDVTVQSIKTRAMDGP